MPADIAPRDDNDTTTPAVLPPVTTGGALGVAMNADASRALWQWCDVASRAGIMPSALRGKPADLFVVVMTGLDLGIRPMAAVQQIAVVNGRPTLSGELMRAMLQAAGYELDIDSNEQTATVKARRAGTDEQWKAASFTFDQAKRAKLTDKDVWRYYAEDMLINRATSRLCRRYFGHIIGGLLATEEARDLQPTQPTVTLAEAAEHRTHPDVVDAEVVPDVDDAEETRRRVLALQNTRKAKPAELTPDQPVLDVQDPPDDPWGDVTVADLPGTRP